MKEKFALGPDAIRVLAVVLVAVTHHVGFSEDYVYTGLNVRWLATMTIFYLSHSCVPLFLLLSGYLCGKKSLTASHYRGIFRILVPYLVVSVLCLLKVRFWEKDTGLQLTTAVFRVLSFRANGYAWYVEMYLGLLLLMPFLNLAYDAMPSERWKKALLGSLILMTLLPDAVGSLGTEEIRADVLPDYFNNCYPVTYYLLGRWIRENETRLPASLGGKLLGLGLLLPLGLCVVRTVYSGNCASGWTMNSFSCLLTAMCAVGVFLLLLRWKACRGLRRPIREISKVSFEMYLCMNVVDSMLYDIWPNQSFAVMGLLSLCSAWVLAELVRLITQPLTALCQTGYDRICGRLGWT